MNRYKITYDNGISLLLYKPSESCIQLQDSIGKVISIELYTDNTHERYIDQIKQQSEFLGYDYKGREVYKTHYYKENLIIKLSKDNSDNTYYDFAEYQEQVANRLLRPITFTLSTPEKVYNLITTSKPEYIVHSHRYYGQPKLSKPKELKNINSIGSATFIPKKCNPQIYVKGNDIWVKHTDYFSSSWIPPKGEKTDMSLSYYLDKYLNTTKKDKFVYPDCWGDIILRNEAWIQLKNYLLLIQTENAIIFAENVILEQKRDKYSSLDDIPTENEWMRFYENVYKVVREYIDKINKEEEK